MNCIKSRKHPASHPTQPSATRAAMLVLATFNLPAISLAAEPGMARTLNEVQVHAEAVDDYKAEAASSPKFTQPLLDTPQTISVIKEPLLREQGATTLTEALRNTPGASTFYLGENGNTSTGDAIYMRGFDSSSSIFVDGVRDLGAVSRDVFNIQQIEVTKGPAGSDTGRTAPSGAINLVSKQPTLEDSFTASVGAGSGPFRRATADWTKALSDYPGAAFRLNVLGEDSGVAGRDYVKNRRWGIAPSVALGLNTPTRTFINFLHVDQDNVPDGGVPTIGLPGYSSPDSPAYAGRRSFLDTASRVDPRNFYGTSSDFDKVQLDMLTVRVEHDFTPTLKLRNTTRVGRTHHDYLLTSFMGAGYPADGNVAANAGFLGTPAADDPASWTIRRNLPTSINQTNRILVNQTNLTQQLTVGGIEHALSGGVELSREEQTNLGYYRAGFPSVATTNPAAGAWPDANLYHPDPNVSGFNRIPDGSSARGRTDTLGLYLFDTAKLSPQWEVTAGLRLDHYRTDFKAVTLGALPAGGLTPSSLSVSDNLLSGKLGVVYKPLPNASVYALVATSAQPPGGLNNQLSAAANNPANPAFDPQKARTYEVGTKWEVLDRRLGLAAALYRTDVSNDVEADPTNPGSYLQIGRKRVQGIELSAVGAITKDWSISAGLTTLDTKIVDGTAKTADGTDGLAYTPRSAFTLWSTYRLPFGVTVGGGARYTGALKRGRDGAVGTPAYVQSYWVFDALASYKVSRNVEIQFNLYNIANEDYVAAINKSGYRYNPGIPRSARITANFLF